MGVFTERLAVLLLLPWSSRGASRVSEIRSGRIYGTPDERAASGPMWKMDRHQGPSSAVQRADLEALRSFTRLR